MRQRNNVDLTKTKMLNIIDSVKFAFSRAEDSGGVVTSSLYKCNLYMIEDAMKDWNFVISNLNVETNIMRSDITVMFNSLITHDSGETSWVKYTGNLNKIVNCKRCGSINCSSNTHVNLRIKITKTTTVYKPNNVVGSIVLIGPPSAETFNGPPLVTVNNNHVSTIENSMKDPSETLPDVTFVLDDGSTVKGCKALLATVSPIFNSMFCGGFSEKDNGEVAVPDTTREAMQKMVRYSVTRNYDVMNESKDVEFIMLCHKYMVNSIVKRWCKYILIRIDKENAVDNFRIAVFLDDNSLMNACCRIIKNNATKIDLAQLEKDELVKIFSSN